MYDRRVRNLRITLLALFVAAGLGVFGVGTAAAQSVPDALGAQSASGDNPSGDQGGVQGEFDNSDNPSGANVPDTADNSPGSGASLPSTDQSTPAASKAAASGSGASLPFTGFLAIPALLAGMALLAAGLVVRQRATA
jgi:hypothetical protein